MHTSALHCVLMSDALDALPDDVATLKRMLIGRDEMIAKLVCEIAQLKRWRFGRSAERIDPALMMQLQLALGEVLMPPAREADDRARPPITESTRSTSHNGAPRADSVMGGRARSSASR